jgi:hypothetical protein
MAIGPAADERLARRIEREVGACSLAGENGEISVHGIARRRAPSPPRLPVSIVTDAAGVGNAAPAVTPRWSAVARLAGPAGFE